MVEYVKEANIKSLVEKIRKYMEKTKPCRQDGDCTDHRLQWAFSSRHSHISGEFLNVLHLSCNLADIDTKG
jgi:hypothetical protein